MFEEVLFWLSDIPFGMVDIERYMSSDDCLESRLRETAKKAFAHRSGGCIDGCIGVLDRWLAKINGDGRLAIFTRKGFNAINVQVLGDHLKRILWLSFKFCGRRTIQQRSKIRRFTVYWWSVLKSSISGWNIFLVIWRILCGRFCWYRSGIFVQIVSRITLIVTSVRS